MSDLASLIARLEAAEGPSRELDWLITRAIAAEIRSDHGIEIAFTSLRHACFTTHDCPEFTASLDSALSLVPEGCIWKVFSDWPGDVFWAVVERQPEHEPWRTEEYRSTDEPTPALALTAAALKARAQG